MALSILFSRGAKARELFYESVLLHAEDIQCLNEDGKTVESEVLAAITHRTNLPLSWRHISPERVAQAALRAQMAQAIERAKAGGQSEQLLEYIELLEGADQELRLKEEELFSLQSEYKAKDEEARVLQSEVLSLKHALTGARSNDNVANDVAEAFAPLGDAVGALYKGNPSLQQVIDLIAALYADRIIFLDSSRNSAKESDRGDFARGQGF